MGKEQFPWDLPARLCVQPPHCHLPGHTLHIWGELPSSLHTVPASGAASGKADPWEDSVESTCLPSRVAPGHDRASYRELLLQNCCSRRNEGVGGGKEEILVGIFLVKKRLL